MIPFPGKIDSRVKAEEKNIDMSKQESEYVKLKIANEVKQIFYEIYMLQRKQSIISENLLFLKQLINTTQTQYSVGKALQEDIVKAQVEYSKALQDSISVENEMKRMIVMMNTVLNRDINLPFENINNFELTKFNFDSLANYNQTIENRPDIKAMKFNIEMSELEEKSAAKEYYPDFMVRLMYKKMGMDQSNYWSLMFSTTLPFLPWSKPMVEYKIQEKEEKTLSDRANYKAMQNMAASEVYASLYKAKENFNKIDIYKSQIIPQAEIALSSNLTSYQNGKTNFLMVLDSYRMLQMFKMEFYMSIAEYEKAMANFEFSIGKGI
jgi:outer membrane protein TolC